MRDFDPELERRIRALEMPAEKETDFTRWDWLALIVLGVMFPVALLIWGWPW
jgi:hypothetical protein